MTGIETATVDLAPNHKVGLALANPVMPAAGCFGFGTAYARLVEVEVLGAVLVGPITARPRRGAEPPRTLPIRGGVLLHTGLANPGVAAVTRRYTRAWARSPVPVIVHVASTTPEETASCCRRRGIATSGRRSPGRSLSWRGATGRRRISWSPSRGRSVNRSAAMCAAVASSPRPRPGGRSSRHRRASCSIQAARGRRS